MGKKEINWLLEKVSSKVIQKHTVIPVHVSAQGNIFAYGVFGPNSKPSIDT